MLHGMRANSKLGWLHHEVTKRANTFFPDVTNILSENLFMAYLVFVLLIDKVRLSAVSREIDDGEEARTQ